METVLMPTVSKTSLSLRLLLLSMLNGDISGISAPMIKSKRDIQTKLPRISLNSNKSWRLGEGT